VVEERYHMRRLIINCDIMALKNINKSNELFPKITTDWGKCYYIGNILLVK